MSIGFYEKEMKKCPVCGGEGLLREVCFDDGDIWYNPQCDTCAYMFKYNYETKEQGVKAWNSDGLEEN